MLAVAVSRGLGCSVFSTFLTFFLVSPCSESTSFASSTFDVICSGLLFFSEDNCGCGTFAFSDCDVDASDLHLIFSPEIQEMFLMDTIESYSDFETTLDTLVTTWQNGDEKGLEKIIIREMNKNPDLKPLYDKLFRERNIEMSLKIEEFLTTDKKFFIVVGSGHLIGEDGIIEILKEKGYTIRQL